MHSRSVAARSMPRPLAIKGEPWSRVIGRALSRASTLGTAVGLLAGLLLVLGAKPSTLDPVLNFDESYNLMLARHLSRTGQYAVEIAGTKLRWFDPAVTTGPTVLVPEAIGLRASGSLLAVPRAIMLAYLALFTAALYLAGWRLGGWLGGTLATVILLWVSWDIYDLGLRILGEVPALAFLLLGVAALARTTSRRSCVLGGVCLGLALLTKPQMIIVAAVLLLGLGLWHHRCREHCYESTLATIIGLAIPIAVWLSVQLFVLGPSEWYRLNEGTLILVTSAGFAGVMSPANILLNHPRIIGFMLVLSCIAYFLFIRLIHQFPYRLTYALRIIALLSILVPIPIIQWSFLTERFLPFWEEHTSEAFVGIAGLFLGLVFSSVKGERWLALVALSGILFAEWSLGISQIYGMKYTIYWRILGLLCFAVVGAALLRYLGQPLVKHAGRWPIAWSRGARAAGMLAALVAAGLLVDHALPDIRRRAAADNSDVSAAARWVTSNTASDAILLGDGWWMPWEVGYLANRDVGNVRTSAFSKLSDLRRPMYLAMDEYLLGEGLLLPSTEALLRREDLRLSHNGTYSIVQWPRPPVIEALSTVEAANLSVFDEIDAGRATFSPAPRGSILDQNHGQFIFPAPSELRQGLTMIATASVSTRAFPVQRASRLFLGFTPPEAGDGVRFSVYVEDPGRRRSSILWTRDIISGGGYEVHVISLEPFANADVALVFSVSSPSGDGTADWLHVSPLIVGS